MKDHGDRQLSLLVKKHLPGKHTFRQRLFVRERRLLVKDYLSGKDGFWPKTNCLTDKYLVKNNLADRHNFWSNTICLTDITFGQKTFVRQIHLLVKDHLSVKVDFCPKTICPTDIHLVKTSLANKHIFRSNTNCWTNLANVFWLKKTCLTNMSCGK